ncbi:MAG TPA: hypothetical protein VFY65_18315 [Longimicrobium sp.]|nr:hypothetical protein [Longimicrobium sp.]
MPLDAIRDATARAVASTSLRSVARDMGMTAMGLRAFLHGGDPRAATLRKLNEWYVREAARTREVSAETVEAALIILLDFFPEDKAGELRRRLLDVLRTAHQENGTDPPRWLK